MTRAFSIHLLISVIALLLFLPFLGNFYLFDWDEINFAESAKEMLLSKNYSIVQISYTPFWEKPPMFIWMQVLCMKIFGINEYAARLPNAIFGVIMLNYIYHIGRKLIGHFKGLAWVIAYLGTLLPFLYHKSGIIDPVFNFFIFVAIIHWCQAEIYAAKNLNTRQHFIFSAIFIGLATLTKGPVAILIYALILIARLVQSRGAMFPGFKRIVIVFIITFLVGGSWYLYLYFKIGPGILQKFVSYQQSLFNGQFDWHTQPFYYHILILFFLCFPASFFALPFLFKKSETKSSSEAILNQYMKLIFWVVLILFSLVKTKIVHYSSLCWIPITYFASEYIYQIYIHKKAPTRLFYWLGVIFSFLIFSAILIGYGYFTFPNVREWFPPLQDSFANAFLVQKYPGEIWEWILLLIIGIVITVYFIVNIKKSGKWGLLPFIGTTVLSLFLYIRVAPKSADLLQKNIVSFYTNQKTAKIDAFQFKSFAPLFYGRQKPADFRGPWTTPEFAKEHLGIPDFDYRLHYMLHTSKNIEPYFVVTKNTFTPNTEFAQLCILDKKIDGYLIWKKRK